MEHTLDLIMTALLLLTIISAFIWGGKFVQLPYKTRFAIVIAHIVLFGGWILTAHVR